jgi:osmotically-inducible protein OsmY
MNVRSLVLLAGAISMTTAWSGGGDPRLDAQVRSALYRDLGARARDIRVDSYGGTVQLTGVVASHSLRLGAQESAAGVNGVNHVLNVLDLGAGQARPAP